MEDKKDYGVIYKREDGSYVINNGLYHVPDIDGFKDEFAKVDEYAKANPSMVLPEPQPAGPTEADLIKAEIAKHQAYLSSTDWYAIRLADDGTPIPKDIKAARANARTEIDRLRAELAALES